MKVYAILVSVFVYSYILKRFVRASTCDFDMRMFECLFIYRRHEKIVLLGKNVIAGMIFVECLTILYLHSRLKVVV